MQFQPNLQSTDIETAAQKAATDTIIIDNLTYYAGPRSKTTTRLQRNWLY
jgi:hypothetical protein